MRTNIHLAVIIEIKNGVVRPKNGAISHIPPQQPARDKHITTAVER